MGAIFHALSIKQPWAALVVHGIKTIEVRAWPTALRGRVLIHAARQVEVRRLPWNLLTDEAAETAELKGGIIGAVELVDCIRYDSPGSFARDRNKHLNTEDWFEPPALYGMVLQRPVRLPFYRLHGWFRFFRVPWDRKLADRLDKLSVADAAGS